MTSWQASLLMTEGLGICCGQDDSVWRPSESSASWLFVLSPLSQFVLVSEFLECTSFNVVTVSNKTVSPERHWHYLSCQKTTGQLLFTSASTTAFVFECMFYRNTEAPKTNQNCHALAPSFGSLFSALLSLIHSCLSRRFLFGPELAQRALMRLCHEF